MDALIIKVDAFGNELWNRSIGGEGDQIVNSVASAADGGFVLAGYERNADNEGRSRAWLMKVEVIGAYIISPNKTGNEAVISRTINSTETNLSYENVPANAGRKSIPSFHFLWVVISLAVLVLLIKRRK